jgi:hypothetical protein
MSRNLHEQSDNWSAPSEVLACAAHEREFVGTVLRLYGIVQTPTPLQLAKSRKIFLLYGIKFALAHLRRPATDAALANSQLVRPPGVEQAFVFVCFDSVLPPDAAQIQALNDWLASEDNPRLECAQMMSRRQSPLWAPVL